MPKELLYWVLNSDKKPLYINASNHVEAGEGVLKTDGTPAHTNSSPTGWSDTLVKWGRNIKYLGLFREFSVPLNTVKDLAKILRNTMWRTGMDAILYLAISKLNKTQFPDLYESWYTGEFDFSKFKQTDTGVDIQLVEGGLSKLLKANETTTFEVNINNDPERFAVYMDGLVFNNKVEWTIFENQDHPFDDMLIGCGIINQEGTTQGVIVNDGDFTVETEVRNHDIIRTVNKNISAFFKLSCIIEVQDHPVLTPDSRIIIRFTKYDKDFNFVAAYEIINAIYPVGTVYINESVTIPINDGENVYIEMAGGGDYVMLSGSIVLTYDVQFDPTLVECLSWFTLFQRITEKITNGKYGCKSTFLQSLTGTQAVTSGEAIRKYKATSAIKTSMEEFFKACKRWGVGLAIENDQLVIERHEYFFRKGTSIELGEVKDITWEVAEDLVCNVIKVGYANQEYDKVNGRDEFNVTQTYTTPHTRIVKELDLICPYRADMFGIELTRLELYGKDTTDNKADNDTFILNVSKGTTYDIYRGTFTTTITDIILPGNIGDFFEYVGKTVSFNGNDYVISATTYFTFGFVHLVTTGLIVGTYNTNISTYDAEVYKLNRPAYSSITGLLNPTQSFNTELTPKHILLNNSAYIHSILDLLESGKVAFSSGEKNSDLITVLGGLTVSQRADLNINGLEPQLFKPYYAKFKTEVPLNFPALMKVQPYDRISFTYKGNEYFGYLWSGGILPATNDVQEWELLSAAENDLTKLI